jgi:hypothetical protein
MDNKLRSILSICPEAFNTGEEFYLKRMAEFRVNYSDEFLSEFREEFLKLKINRNYSFKITCKELTFFAYDSEQSELDIKNYLTNFFINSNYLR